MDQDIAYSVGNDGSAKSMDYNQLKKDQVLPCFEYVHSINLFGTARIVCERVQSFEIWAFLATWESERDLVYIHLDCDKDVGNIAAGTYEKKVGDDESLVKVQGSLGSWDVFEVERNKLTNFQGAMEALSEVLDGQMVPSGWQSQSS